MGNKFYSPDHQRAEKVNDLFTLIATRYDLMNDVQSLGLHRFWKRRLVRRANPKPNETALDLCCGTGDISFALARRGARVTGLDFNAPMLAVAEARCRTAIPGTATYKPRFIRGDALQVPFSDDSFDIVTISYGLRNLANAGQGLREMKRVTKPGGRLLVLDFGKPDHRLWRGIYFGYLRFFIPVLGRIFAGDSAAYAYILESLKHFPAQRGIDATLRELGLRNAGIDNLLGGVMGINYAEKPGGK